MVGQLHLADYKFNRLLPSHLLPKISLKNHMWVEFIILFSNIQIYSILLQTLLEGHQVSSQSQY